MFGIRLRQKRVEHTRLIFSLILICGLSLQLYGLGSKSLWYDEVSSIKAAEAAGISDYFFKGQDVFGYRPPLDYSNNPIFPPLYFSVLWAYTQVFGTGELSVRLFSALFGFLTIPVLYKFGKEFLDERAGLLGSLLLATTPLFIQHSQTVKMYTMLMFAGLLSFYFFLHALKTNSNKHWFLYSLSTVLAFHVHYFMGFLFIGEMAFFALNESPESRRKKYRKLLLCAAVILILFLPQILKIAVFFWYNEGASGIMRASNAPIFYNYDRLGILRLLEPSYSLSDAGLAAALLTLCVFAFSIISTKERPKRALGAGAVLVPGGLLAAYSLLSRVHGQYFLFILPFFMLFVASGLLSIKSRRVFALLTIAIISLNCVGLYGYYETPNHDYRSAAAFLGSIDEEDVVVIEPSVLITPFRYYTERDVIGMDEDDWNSPEKFLGLHSANDEFWYIYNFHLEWRDQDRIIKDWLDDNCELEREFHALSFYFCARQ